MPLRAALVVTTITDSVLLEDYDANFRAFGHLDQVDIFVIPDRKTPLATYARCQALAAQGARIVCPTVEEQGEWLRRIGFPAELIPDNSDNRRNIGYLMALEAGADFILSIDDDNWCRAREDCFAEHSVVCQPARIADVVHTESGWWNLCGLLEYEPRRLVYPRGYPYFARHRDAAVTLVAETVQVWMNAGLWLSEPDLDAMTWLVAPVRAHDWSGLSPVLGRNTWAPVNTQNTALARSVMPAYWFVQMGYPLAGMPIDRYGDIVSGYFSQACVRHLGGSVRVGSPIADHRRNTHQYLRDAANEMACIQLLEDILPWLHDLPLSGATYGEAYVSLSELLQQQASRFSGTWWNDVSRGYLHSIAHTMRVWVAVCRRLGANSLVEDLPMSGQSPRLPLLEREQASPELHPLFDALLRDRGVVPNMFKTVAQSPELALGFAAFLKPLLRDSALPGAYKELVSTLVARRLDCDYCATAHTISAIQKGATREQIEALDDYGHGPFSAAEKVGFRVADRLHESPHGIDDALYAEARRHFSEKQFIELAAVAAAFEFFPRFVSALRIPVTPPPPGFEWVLQRTRR